MTNEQVMYKIIQECDESLTDLKTKKSELIIGDEIEYLSADEIDLAAEKVKRAKKLLDEAYNIIQNEYERHLRCFDSERGEYEFVRRYDENL